ncbi:MAG: hypothetical protein QXF01_00460 [Candidatus Micrarchaeaceae archaeon]
MKRLQASIEFLLVLTAISILCLGSLLMFNNEAVPQFHALDALKLQNFSALLGSESAPLSDPAIDFYMPLNSTATYQSSFYVMLYGCESGSADIELNSSSIAFSENQIAINFSGVYTQPIRFVPLGAGYDLLYLKYVVSCSGNVLTGSSSLRTYAALPAQAYQQAGLSASIQDRNESLLFPESESSSIFSLSQKSACTMINFWGNPLGMQAQCGTANGWDYNIFSDYCYTSGSSSTSTYCIIPRYTGYNITTLNYSKPGYVYSFKLLIYTQHGTLQSNITSLQRSNNVTLYGKNVGSAVVYQVSDNYQSAEQAFLSWGGNYIGISESNLSSYEQAMGNLYSTLNYYNGSYISVSAQSSINQAIAYYMHQESKIVSNSKSAMPEGTVNCRFANETYRCPALPPFSYIINVTLDPQLGIGEHSLSFQGTIVNLN